MDIVLEVYLKPDKARKTKFVKDAMVKLNKLGIVGMHDAGVVPGELQLYKGLSANEDWTVRVYAMIECDVRNTFCPDAVEKVITPNGKFHVQGVKLFAGFTINPAYGAFLEGKAGVIDKGAYADWVVLDQPLDSLNLESLRKVTIEETWVGGKRVYQRPKPRDLREE